MKGDLTMWVTKSKSGKFEFSEYYIDPITNKRRRVVVTFDKNNSHTSKLAQVELSKKIRDKTNNQSNGVGFFSVCETYLSEKKDETKSSTYKTYVSNINTIKEAVQDIELDKITVLYIDQVSKPLGRWTQMALKSLLIWAFKKDYLQKDIGRKMTIKRVYDKKDKLYYEKEEIKEILEILDNGQTYIDKLLRLLIEFLVLTGVRIGEALALTEDDIRRNIISINKRYYKGEIASPKSSAAIRDLAVNHRCMQIISEMKLLKRMFRIESKLLFPSGQRESNEYLEPGTLRDALKRKGLNAGLHIFRHTHASILAESGIQLDLIQRRLGHEKSDITKKIYIHVTERMKNKDNAVFSNLNIL